MTPRRVLAALAACTALLGLSACAPGSGGGTAQPPPAADPVRTTAPAAEPEPGERESAPAPAEETPRSAPPEEETGHAPASAEPDNDRTPPATPAPPDTSPEPETEPGAGPPPQPEAESVPEVTTLHIGDWSRPVIRGDQADVDRCQEAVLFTGPDIGRENGYELDTTVIVGHDHCGFDHFATLPAGTRVTVTGPAGTRHYEVYAHHITPGRGGPDHGLYWGDITL